MPDADPWAGGDPGSLDDELDRAMLARRTVLLHGTLGDAPIARAAATLMMLDVSGDERIVVRLTSTRSTVDAGLVLMDTIEALGVPVDTFGLGTIAGGAIGVLASGRLRTLAPHSRLHLDEPDATVAGRAVDIERALAAHQAQRDRFTALLAARTGRPAAHLVAEWATERFLEPTDAVTLGYADGVGPIAKTPKEN